MTDVTFFDDPDLDRAVGLVFDLAAQLHIERQRRLALEEAVVRAGVISRADLQALAGEEQFLTEARAGLDRSLERLMRVVTEDGPAAHPLRAEARKEDA